MYAFKQLNENFDFSRTYFCIVHNPEPSPVTRILTNINAIVTRAFFADFFLIYAVSQSRFPLLDAAVAACRVCALHPSPHPLSPPWKLRILPVVEPALSPAAPWFNRPKFCYREKSCRTSGKSHRTILDDARDLSQPPHPRFLQVSVNDRRHADMGDGTKHSCVLRWFASRNILLHV